jgi:hypothetical protein
MAENYPDTWGYGNKCMISVIPYATTAISTADAVSFEPIVTSIRWNPGRKGQRVINTVNGGQLTQPEPQEIATLEFEAYWTGNAVEATTTSTGVGPDQFFNDTVTGATFAGFATEAPYRTFSSASRGKHLVAILMTNDTAATTATSAVSSSYAGYRIVVQRAKMAEMSGSFEDGVWKGNFKFELPGLQKDGTTPNYYIGSCTGSATTLDVLPVIALTAEFNASSTTQM